MIRRLLNAYCYLCGQYKTPHCACNRPLIHP